MFFSPVFPSNTPRKLVNLCLGVLGGHLEDIVEHLPYISVILPHNIKVRALTLTITKIRSYCIDLLLLLILETFITVKVKSLDSNCSRL